MQPRQGNRFSFPFCSPPDHPRLQQRVIPTFSSPPFPRGISSDLSIRGKTAKGVAQRVNQSSWIYLTWVVDRGKYFKKADPQIFFARTVARAERTNDEDLVIRRFHAVSHDFVHYFVYLARFHAELCNFRQLSTLLSKPRRSRGILFRRKRKLCRRRLLKIFFHYFTSSTRASERAERERVQQTPKPFTTMTQVFRLPTMCHNRIVAKVSHFRGP